MTLAFIIQWWNELTIAKQLFYGTGLIAGLVTVILGILAMLGMDDGDAADALDATDASDTDTDGGIFSLKSVTGFFLGFGWAGGIALDKGLGIAIAVAIALVVGALIMAGIVVMMRLMYSLRSDGTMRIQDTVGKVGTVYLSLPASKAQGGQVTVNFSGRQETFEALNNSQKPVPSGDKIRVLEVIDARTLLVEPLSQQTPDNQ